MQDRDFKAGEAVSPVTGWAMMPLREHDSLLLRLDFLSDPSPTAMGRAGRGRVYAMTSEQLQLLLPRQLAPQLRALRQVPLLLLPPPPLLPLMPLLSLLA